MHHVSFARVAASALVLLAAGLSHAASAHAFTAKPVWKCRASAGYTVVNGGDRAETIVANGNVNAARGKETDRALCGSGEAGGGNLPAPLGIPADLLAAGSASAVTDVDPELGSAHEQRIGAAARVENLALRLAQGAPILFGVTAAESVATGQCAGGQPQLGGTSRVTGTTIAGEPVSGADALAAALTSALSSLNALVTVRQNETIRSVDSLTVRALHIVVRRGPVTLADTVIAESKVGFDGRVCVPRPPICPQGSDYNDERNMCVIAASDGEDSIDVGSPANSPKGGIVLNLTKARRRYGNSPCLSGPGAKYVTVGGKKSDRITGTNQRDRMLGFGGNDRLDGGRNGDCLDGGVGGDILSGALGTDRVYGESGNDHLNGGSGNDRLSGGRGNDTINGGYGADRVSGGAGRDAINVSTAGPLALANCGSGSDKVRVNRREKRRTKGCETVYVLPDR